jgi:O-antigen/teichoic acid export membrane protein
MTIAVPLFLLIILFSQPLMTVWMGAEFASKSWPYLSLLAIDKIFASFSMVPILIALGIGYARTRAMFSLVAVVLYVTLLPLLTEMFGLYGTVFAAIFSATPGLVFILYVAHNILKYPIKQYLKKTVVIHAIPIVITAGVFIISANQWIPNTIWGLAIAPTIGLAYILILYAVGWTPSVEQLRQRLRPVS